MTATQTSTTAETLRTTALGEFVQNGYLGTSLQQIADRAGVSKANVLYHFASKEALLEASVAPAMAALEVIVDGLAARPTGPGSREQFVADYVDLLLERHLEVHLFINQWTSLVDVPVIQRAHELIIRLGDHLEAASPSPVDRLRVGIALAGSAYILATADQFETSPAHGDVREPLIAVMRDLLAPPASPAPPASASTAPAADAD